LRLFLGKITRNLALNKYKEKHTAKRGGETALLLSELEYCIPSHKNVAMECEAHFAIEIINNCLRSMDSESRRVFIRRYWHADSIHVIAERYQMSESKVKSMLFRARKTLKACLVKEGVVL